MKKNLKRHKAKVKAGRAAAEEQYYALREMQAAEWTYARHQELLRLRKLAFPWEEARKKKGVRKHRMPKRR